MTTATVRGERAREVWAYVSERCLEGHPPSIREIRDAVGLTTTSTVVYHLERLERLGYIKRPSVEGIWRRETPTRAIRVLIPLVTAIR